MRRAARSLTVNYERCSGFWNWSWEETLYLDLIKSLTSGSKRGVPFGIRASCKTRFGEQVRLGELRRHRTPR